MVLSARVISGTSRSSNYSQFCQLFPAGNANDNHQAITGQPRPEPIPA
jgi:hypothetical protein